MKLNSKILLTLILCLSSNCLIFSQNNNYVFDIDLWENGAPNNNGQTDFDESKGNFKPSMKVFLAKESNGRFILLCPGGGYGALAYHHEGYDWAPYFNKQGINVAVLKYRMPKGVDSTIPRSDVEEALRIINDNAENWSIDKNDIGIMGFSAGGHLASTVATHTSNELKPNFQILMYPVITMDQRYTHQGSRNNLLGLNPDKDKVNLYSNELQVDETSPRAFIAFSNDDDIVSPINGVNYYLALHNKNVPAALYIYPTGGHGWGISEHFLYKNRMLDELGEWLRSFKPE